MSNDNHSTHDDAIAALEKADAVTFMLSRIEDDADLDRGRVRILVAVLEEQLAAVRAAIEGGRGTGETGEPDGDSPKGPAVPDRPVTSADVLGALLGARSKLCGVRARLGAERLVPLDEARELLRGAPPSLDTRGGAA